MSDFDPRALRTAFGTFMTGVTVVTAHDSDGQPVGFTANSFTSVSLDPPLVLVCMARNSRNFEAFAAAQGFAVNILSEWQKETSNTFARPVEDRFAHVLWKTGPHGAPILADVSAWFDCSMHDTIEAGDHLILMGRVEAFEATTTPGLGYARGAYVSPAVEAEALAHGTDLIVSALIEHEGRVVLLDHGPDGLVLPQIRVGRKGATAALMQLISQIGVNADPGFVYSVFEDEQGGSQNIVFMCPSDGAIPKRGTFVALSGTVLVNVSDPIVRAMLERFEQESRMGNFGVYFGTQTSGKIRHINPTSE